MMGMAFERLELSEQQREEIHAILETQREESSELRGVTLEKRRALHAAARAEGAEGLDEEAIRLAASELAAVEAEIVIRHARVRQRVRSVLTPEQRDELEQMREEREERRVRRHEQMGGFPDEPE